MIKNFQQFEALLPSQFRDYVKDFDRDRYADVFKFYKDKYDGDKNAYRIYLPLLTATNKINPIEKKISDFLEKNNYIVVDYFNGLCKFKDAKNPSRIGQVLTRLKEDKLMKNFTDDPERKKGNNDDLMVCISRHPYDIAGSDTDRNWTNCMTMGLHDNHGRIQKLKQQLKELEDKGEDEKKIKELKDKIKNYKEKGENVKYLKHEVHEGSLISYLIKKDDRNINNPLSVLNIKPYNDDKEIILKSCAREYGVKNDDFKFTVNKWLEEINKDKYGGFSLNKNVYRDNDKMEILIPKPGEIGSKMQGGILVDKEQKLVVSEMDLGYVDWETAKKLCSDYRGGEFDDWRLPTKDELNQVYLLYKKGIDGFVINGSHTDRWCTSNYSANSAYKQIFSNGCFRDLDKDSRDQSTGYVRAVRIF